MKDLTQGPIVRHLIVLASPLVVSMLAQIAYQMIDLYFVTQLGAAATAGVNAASNVMFIVNALMQVLGSGTAAAVAHAVGRKDRREANLLLNQSLLLGALCGAAMMTLLYASAHAYLEAVASDAAVVNSGIDFMFWILPGYALLLPWTAVAAGLRGTGVVQWPLLTYALTLLLNALLAPVLIAGWLTGVPLGVRGAGLATSISILVGVAVLGIYVHCSQRYVRVNRALLWPKVEKWRRILSIGLPAGTDFALTFVATAVTYFVIRDFGADAQAGFGIGWRVLQTILLPGIAIGFAAAPIAGQNFGAGNGARVRETFNTTALLASTVMLGATAVVQWQAHALAGVFGADAATSAYAALFLRLMSWTLIAQALIYACSSMFQGLGNTVPSLLSSTARFVSFAAAVAWLSAQPGFRLDQVWYASSAAILLQAFFSAWLLRKEFSRRLSRASAQHDGAVAKLEDAPL